MSDPNSSSLSLSSESIDVKGEVQSQFIHLEAEVHRDSKIRRTAVKNKTSFNRESASDSFSSYQALAKAIRS